MKGYVLLVCALFFLSSQAAVIDVTPCAIDILGLCDILQQIEGTLEAGDSLAFDQFTTAANLALSSSISIAGIDFSAAEGSVLNILEGVTINLSNTLQLAEGTVLTVAGSLFVAAATTVGDTAALIIAEGGSAQFQGGITVSAAASASGEGLILDFNASAIIYANSAINGALSLAANSTFIIRGGIVTAANDVNALGTTIVETVFQFTSGTYTQAQGLLHLGTTTSADAVIDADVSLGANAWFTGQGNVTGDLNANAGSYIAVGNSPGTTYVNGDFSISSTTTFELDIASDLSYDRVIVSGSVSLNGILYVHLEDNYAPTNGDKYTFITSLGTVSGKFNIIHGDILSKYISKFSDEVNSHSVVAVYNSANLPVVSFLLLTFAVIFASL